MTKAEQMLTDAVHIAFDKNKCPRPPEAIVKIIVAVASDCYDLGYKAGVKRGLASLDSLVASFDYDKNETKEC